MKFYLIVAKGGRKGMPIPISVDLFLIGSDQVCQLRNKNLPPKHCALVVREKKVFIRDFDSGHVAVVNGAVLPPGEEWPLHPGDRLEVGNLAFLIQFHEKALSQRDLEEWAMGCLDVDSTRNLLEEYDEFHKATTASSAAAQIIDKLNVVRGQVMGRLRIGVERGVTVVRFNDQRIVEEAEISHIKKELCENLNRNNLRVLLDLKNVRRLSANGLTMLRDFRRWLKTFGSTMAICRIRSEIKEMLSMLQVEAIPVFHDKTEAFDAKW
jgi:anti-anti-sigma regulatory factor